MDQRTGRDPEQGAQAVQAVQAAQEPQAAEMTMSTIPCSGETLPAIGLGTWQTFDVGRDAAARDRLAEVLGAFVALGGRLIDSSPMYGSAEEVVGDLAQRLALRERLFVATKVWTEGREAGVRQMRESMRRLQSGPVDLMQVHNLVDVDDHLRTLDEWKREGLVRYVGVTHYTARGHAAVERILATQPVDFVQINYSIAEREVERRLLPLAIDKGIAVIVNRPFASGDLLRRIRQTPLPKCAAELECTSWPQLLLKFVIAHPAVTCAIPATASLDHLRDNMRAGRGPLPDARQRDMIAEAAH
ncbi:MAG: aldo/keto reductase [Burkholderiaceae bacterium]